MRFKWHPDALDEFHSAALYYSLREIGLDARFITEVEAAIEKAIESPGSWPLIDDLARKCRANVFPYSVIYIDIEDFIVIVAVMHESRDPDYWKYRLE